MNVVPINVVPDNYDYVGNFTVAGSYALWERRDGTAHVVGVGGVDGPLYRIEWDEEPWEDPEDILDYYLDYVQKNL